MSLFAGPCAASSFATAEKVPVEKLEYEPPIRVKLMEEIGESFNRASTQEMPFQELNFKCKSNF